MLGRAAVCIPLVTLLTIIIMFRCVLIQEKYTIGFLVMCKLFDFILSTEWGNILYLKIKIQKKTTCCSTHQFWPDAL